MGFEEVTSIEFAAVQPYSFELTMHKPAGWWWSTPDEVFEDNTLWTATRFRNALIGLKLKSMGTLKTPKIRCAIFSDREVSDAEKRGIVLMTKRALGTQEDITGFYKLAQKDEILRAVVKDLYGMHTLAWPELFPALILAVTLQMAPMKRSNQMMELLLENFGDQTDFDEKTVRYWPSPERIASVTPDRLKAKAKLGYRAENLVAIAKALKAGFPEADELWAMDSEAAKKRLMSLRGIGDYSAEIIMPRMGFPLDVWSAKIFHILFFGKEPESPRETIPILKRTAEEKWGEWRGYVFVYVLNDLPKISERIGIDLTRF